MSPQVVGGVEDDGNGVEASDVVPSLVLETDDIVSCGVKQEGQAQQEEEEEKKQQQQEKNLLQARRNLVHHDRRI